jgi:hypothetical protein
LNAKKRPKEKQRSENWKQRRRRRLELLRSCKKKLRRWMPALERPSSRNGVQMLSAKKGAVVVATKKCTFSCAWCLLAALLWNIASDLQNKHGEKVGKA